MNELFPQQIPNQIGGREIDSRNGLWLDKLNPANGRVLAQLARSTYDDVNTAIEAAQAAQGAWAATPPVKRGEVLHAVANAMEKRRADLAQVVAQETGKSNANALGETDGAIALARFYAGEGQRLYARTTTSGTVGKWAMTIRAPVGIAGLIIAANTPIANVAWKVFPALICGNAAILKAPEDTPATAWLFAKIAQEAGLPDGVLNVVQGLGHEAGEPLVKDARVGVISFTGSTKVGRQIAVQAGERLAKVSLELGGKNPLIVCDDADMATAVKWSILSAFSNAGQRCAAGSRLIVFDSVYDEFRDRLIEATKQLKVGPADSDDLGPVINERQLNGMLEALRETEKSGARVLAGGHRMSGEGYDGGFYMAPTVVEGAAPDSEFSQRELFGPITALYRARDFEDALRQANDSPYGLTACIHTKSVHRATEFIHRVQAGVAVVNAGTYGSEPHMPFGGVKQSGNGSREPGTEALDVYSDLKDVYLCFDAAQL
jgi:acyl-CoA reductase-like NAD-dependent aldehyde dehydrogenase